MRAPLLRSHPASLSLGLLLSELRPPCHSHRPPLPLAEQCAQLAELLFLQMGPLPPQAWTLPRGPVLPCPRRPWAAQASTAA